MESWLLRAESSSHSNCNKEAIDAQQLHPVTNVLLGYLSLSTPPRPTHPSHRLEKLWHPQPWWLQITGPFCRRTCCEALLVRRSLTFIPLCRREVTLDVAAGRAGPVESLLPSSCEPCLGARCNICLHNRPWSGASTIYSYHRTPASFSWAINLFFCLVSVSVLLCSLIMS